MRRHIQITLDHFDFSQDHVTELDFAGERERSRVYNPETKGLLARIFAVQCQLALALTSTIMTIYPLNGVAVPDISNKTQFSKIHDLIDQSKRDLAKWVEKAKVQLDDSLRGVTAPHASVALYADLTYIYYLYVFHITHCVIILIF